MIMLRRFGTLLITLLLIGGPALAQQNAPAPAAAPPQPPPWAWGPMPGHMWGGYGYGHGWSHGWWMPAMFILFMLVVCALVFYLVNGRYHRSGLGLADRMWHSSTASGLQILNERFARGEIDKAEYEDRKTTILSFGPPRA